MNKDRLKILDLLKENSLTYEVIRYIEDVEKMINDDVYDKDKIIEIESKYAAETKILLNLNNNEELFFKSNYTEPEKQVLENLRERLFYIAIYKNLKRQGKEVPKELFKLSDVDVENLISK